MKIGFGFFVIMLLAAGVAYLGSSGLIAVKDRVGKADDVNRLVKYILEVRRSEKNYILRQDQQHSDDVLAKLEEMRKQVRETKTKFTQDVNKIQMDDVATAVDDYANSFYEYLDIEVKQKEQEANMVRVARELEKIAIALRQNEKKEYTQLRTQNANEADLDDKLNKADAANRMIKWMLECRQDEKNFILRNDIVSSQQVTKNIKKIINQANDLKNHFTKEENKKMAQQIIVDAESYQKAFLTYNELNNGLNVNLEKMVEAARSVENTCGDARTDQKAKMLNEMNLSINLMLGGTIAIIVLGVFISFAIIRAITVPIDRITVIAKEISSGDLGHEVEIVQKDEIGQLADAFRNMKESMQEQAVVAQKISQGDLNIEVIPKSTKDVLGNALVAMIKNLQEQADVAQKISQGNLNIEVIPKSTKDVLGNALAAMTRNLQEQTGALKEAVNVLSSSTSEIATTVTQLAASVSETATSANETTTTVEEVRQTADLTSKKSKAVSEGAQKAQQISIDGKKATDEAIEGMGRIKIQMTSIAESIVILSEQSQAIGEIIATVDDIAEQANLLSVNASIEAVKAGEMGKGFSVVAQEIKDLAKQSKQGTKRVRAILNEIQRATGKAVMVTEEGSKTVEAGVKQAKQSGGAISTLTTSITEATQAAIQIAASSQQQLVGMDQVGTIMMDIKEACAQNDAGTRQLETAVQNLSELGQKLKQVMEWYKVTA
ncbi:methyl-accepting chemotaxis protein [Desulfocicer vacuolatum]|nr:methyl-accepting chemotaxis protein [Desulfocicer vacuolatum]